MHCKSCKTEMVQGIVLQPVRGQSNGRKPVRGDSLHDVSAAVVKCLRCSTCGHSVVSEPLYTWNACNLVPGEAVKESDLRYQIF